MMIINSDNDKVVKWLMLQNSVAIICFTILAIVFNKWWISLLSILFLSSVEDDKEGDKE